jgi:hypothetical protein
MSKGSCVRTAPYSVPRDIRATFARILAYMGGLAILAIVAASFFENQSAVIASVNPSPRPEWTRIERPRPAFDLQMPELAAGSYDYAILHRTADDARKDVLSWGEAAGNGPYVMVEIERPGPAGEHFIDAPSEIAARILDYTVTDDVKSAGEIDSKFGPVPLVDFAIAAYGKARRCLGFAQPFDQPAMQIAGWYCGAGDVVVDRVTLACMLDRLTILSAGGDPKLDILFARAELKRNFCGQRNPILAATPEHDVSVPAPRTIKLRGQLPQR